MTEPAKMQPQRIKVSRKRQITIPARAYRDMGFTEYALIEQTDEGLLIKPLAVEDEGVSLDALRRLIAEGYEGEALIERYAAVCPHVIRFEGARATVPGNGGANAASGIGGARAAGFAGEGAGAATPASKGTAKAPVPPDGAPEEERTRVLDAVARECARFEAITRGYVFGSFARGDFVAASDVDVRLEYDQEAPFTLFEVAQFQKHLERACGRAVDVVTAKQVKNPNLAAAIEREKVLVYER